MGVAGGVMGAVEMQIGSGTFFRWIEGRGIGRVVGAAVLATAPEEIGVSMWLTDSGMVDWID
jgi:hypothetical protein